MFTVSDRPMPGGSDPQICDLRWFYPIHNYKHKNGSEGWELGLYTHLYTHYVVPGIHPVYHLYTLPKKEIIHLYTPVYHLYNLLYTWHHVVSPVHP